MSVMLKDIKEIECLGQKIKGYHTQVAPRICFTTQYQKTFDTFKEFHPEKPFEQIAEEALTDVIGRALWYGYVANVTAYNLQYQEHAEIDFGEGGKSYGESETTTATRPEVRSDLESLIYNIYTNDGNYFLADSYVNVLMTLLNFFDEKPKSNWFDLMADQTTRLFDNN